MVYMESSLIWNGDIFIYLEGSRSLVLHIMFDVDQLPPKLIVTMPIVIIPRS